MEAFIGVAKVRKYASSDSGDTVEMIERPGGGLSCVMVDGQRSGKGAKTISNLVARKAISLLADGVRDGAAARAASDYLFTHRSGKVMATLNILSIDLASQTLVITRNSPIPVLLVRDGRIETLAEPSEAVGTRRGIRPCIAEIPLAAGLVVLAYTDGLTLAGDRKGAPMNVERFVRDLLDAQAVEADLWADALLTRAVELDDGRPMDDITVVVAAILPGATDPSRRMNVRMPLDG
jgi:serine phosphatase RsbU (regulator of sigma subunit)